MGLVKKYQSHWFCGSASNTTIAMIFAEKMAARIQREFPGWKRMEHIPAMFTDPNLEVRGYRYEVSEIEPADAQQQASIDSCAEHLHNKQVDLLAYGRVELECFVVQACRNDRGCRVMTFYRQADVALVPLV